MDNKKIFSKFLVFLNELNEVFGSSNNGIQLYYKLCKKTSISNASAVSKHVEYLIRFLLPNKELILSNNFKEFSPEEIRFDKNDKVVINLKSVMSLTDKETRDVIFKHLQLLLLLVSSDDQHETMLKTIQSKPQTSNEENFLNSFMQKVENNFNKSDINQNTNPMELAMNLLKSGVLTDMTNQMSQDIKNGNLKIDKLIGNIQSLIGDLTEGQSATSAVSNSTQMTGVESSNPNYPQMDPNNMINMAANLVSSLSGSSCSNTSTEPNSMLNMAAGLLSSLGGSVGADAGLDPNGMMNMAANLMSSLGGSSSSDITIDPSSMINMASNLMGSLSGSSGGEPTSDPHNMMNMAASLLGSLGGLSIEDDKH